MPTCPSCGATLEAQDGVCLKCGGATMADTRQRTSFPSGTMDEGRFPPGTVLAQRYRIVSLLGRGGMGEVYRANDLLLGQTVALKFLPPAFSNNEELLNRFRSEVRIARMVSHPNVCRVFDIGEVDGSTYLSMEYVDGEDLSSLVRRIGALPRDKALEIAREICAGLAAAHAKGVIHRDLKPANIMIDGQGQARVTDFGLAGFAEQVRDIRSGTPAYMAPEQRAGTQVSARSDIYALGIVLHELFTGKRPDEKGSKVALEPAVDQVIQRCLAADPEKRPASALAVSAALPGGDPLAIALAAGETPTPEMVADAGAGEGMRPAMALLCLVAVVLMLAGAAILQQRKSILSLLPLELPPQILALKARELARSFGYARLPLTTVVRWRRDDSYLEHLETRTDAATRPARLRGNRPPAMYFWYRESPAPMFAPPSGEIQRFDPPISAPGMLMLTLDSEGRLLEFRGRPWPEQNESARAADWSSLLGAAGFDPQKLKSVPPEWAPEMPCDAQAAWIGTWPGSPGEPLRVEAGVFRGQPVYFSAAGQWPHDSGPEESVPGLRIVIATALIVSLLAIPIIRRNMRLGRGDSQGAFRLACFVCLCSYGLRAMHHTHTWTAAEVEVQLDAVAYGVVWALICGMMYLAFEPTVRRRAPERLFAWNRLLAGKFSDPLLGRHVLVGVVFGCAVNLLAPFTVAPLTMALTPTADWSGSLTRILWPALMAVGSGMACTLLLLLLRIVSRHDWAATALLVAVLFLLRGPLAAPGQTTLWALTLARSVLMVYLLLRFGLLPMIVAGFTSGVLGYAPLTTHLSAWYARDALVAFAITLALAVYGFRTTLAGRPVFGKELTEEVLG